MPFNKEYWENRYLNDEAPWDTGSITAPLKEYIDQIIDKTLKILIPGAGNAHELDYLFSQGFHNVFIIDLAPTPLENIKSRNPNFPDSQLLLGDFFDLNDTFDLILEQTFFCALSPELRPQYAVKMHEILKPGGKIAGLLFDFPLTEAGPPFGGSETEYRGLFADTFTIKKLERAHNSIKPRQDRELFFIFEKKITTQQL
ncbi:TPMT family class I SAM-dependent methyltransferase [Flavobacterium cerinum]|uniref:TPMT family class I SAM-dependent methyltransferase n=2 Tax=Flavobacterium cerinum TaxID=2502784 RepID=A0ABY5IXH9_9FLAO|nr:methyltransferase domain-containing protein [Flavobacterium cerinum]UUC47369.1 TPMT family class I SAM-dependent methyltransferase [Flavobacterium cerinum]